MPKYATENKSVLGILTRICGKPMNLEVKEIFSCYIIYLYLSYFFIVSVADVTLSL